ncbi:MAG: acetyl-CoA carboxylase biotin carboxyl carrier protein subunit [Gemmatimonadota bacterium]
MKYHADAGFGERLVDVSPGRVALDGQTEACHVEILPSGERFLVRFRDRTAKGFARRCETGWEIAVAGRMFEVRVDDERAHHIRELAAFSAPAASGSEVRAPMPGLIVRITIEEGQTVDVGEGLVVMEAMKMENELRAESTGVVSAVHVLEGTTVDRDDLLITIEQESA